MSVNRTMITKLYAKVEATSGTEETIAGADLCKIYGDGAGIWQLDQEQVQIDPIVGTMTGVPLTPGISRVTSSFDFLLQGTGAPAAEPYWARFFKAAACSVTSAVVSTNTEYTIKPSDALSDQKSLTLHGYHESNKHIGIGMMGSVGLVCEAGRLMRCTSNLSGISAATPVVGGASPPSGTLQTNRSPKFEGVQLSIDGYTGGTLRRFEFNTGTNAVDDLDASATTSLRGLKGRVITSRAPTITMVLRAEHNLPKDFFSMIVNGTAFSTLSWSKASLDAADTISFLATGGQIRGSQIQNADGLILYQLNITPVNDTANLDWSIKVATTTT